MNKIHRTKASFFIKKVFGNLIESFNASAIYKNDRPKLNGKCRKYGLRHVYLVILHYE